MKTEDEIILEQYYLDTVFALGSVKLASEKLNISYETLTNFLRYTITGHLPGEKWAKSIEDWRAEPMKVQLRLDI